MESPSEIRKRIDDMIEEVLSKQHVDIADPIREYISRGGKRIRPMLAVLSSRMFSPQREEVFLNFAVGVELFHNFTLIHDDIEDGSLFRRGKPTMHVLYGVPVALNLGDALYTVVWEVLINSGLTKKEMNAVITTFKEVVFGQHLELSLVHEEEFDLDYQTYETIAGNKTGSLIALCISLPSLEVKGREYYQRLYSAVRQLGIAFQIRDDVLNITGDFEKYKKKIGDDITEGKRTLLVIHAIKNLPEKEAKELKKILMSHTENEEEIKRAVELIKKSGAVDFAEERAREIIEENLSVVEEMMPDTEEKKLIRSTVESFISRKS